MTTVIILLSIIAAALILGVCHFIRYSKTKTYAAISSIDNCIRVVRRDPFSIKAVLDEMSSEHYELVAVHRTKNWSMMLFFSRKRVKSYTEE